MRRTMSRRGKYSKENGTQKDKKKTIEVSIEQEIIVEALLKDTGLFTKVERYESEKYLGDSPATTISNGLNTEVICAPDIRCYVSPTEFFWVDVKDKSQRFKYPDTGCDLHQYIGYYKINKYNHEPVLLFFKDPPLNVALASIERYFSGKIERREIEQMKKDYSKRWGKFAPNGKPYYYGNWLDILSDFSPNLGYPICEHGHSREKPMDICYMHIEKMISYEDPKVFLNLLKNFDEHRNAPYFKLNYRGHGIIDDISFFEKRINQLLKNW